MIRISFLTENSTRARGILAEHGLSIFIETDDKKILFDTGASSLLLHNAASMGINLRDADVAVISHGHYDHTQGLPHFAIVNKKAPIYIHKEAFGETYGIKGPDEKEEAVGILWSRRQREMLKNRLVLTDGPMWITEDIVISGTIPSDESMTETFYIKNKDKEPIPDPMNHEQFLAIRDNRGVFLFSACSHKGVVSAVRYAENLFPGEKVFLLAGGMHLYSTDEGKRQAAVSLISAEDIEYFMPVHCTGPEGRCAMKSILGERCILAGAGEVYEY